MRLILINFLPISTLFLIPFFLGGASGVYAESEFQTDYNVSYRVDNAGRVRVKQEIKLTNKTSRYYATKFTLSLGITKVANIKAFDELGILDAVSRFENNTTSLEVDFNRKTIGVGKSYLFTIEYDGLELSNKAGQIWEVHIPRLVDNEEIGSYNVTLMVSTQLGPEAFVTPVPVAKTVDGDYYVYRFVKNQLVERGISAAFGKRQIFSFDLKYHLTNPNIVPVIVQIALPPDTPYQRVIYTDIKPKPINVKVDGDGNWLADFQLTSRQKLDVEVTGQVETYPVPRSDFKEKLTQNVKDSYLTPQPFWDVSNPLLAKKAAELKSVDRIYEFVVNYLKYDSKRLESSSVKRLGSLVAFGNPDQAVCMEFTDLFIALARAAGIPAREINGFAFSQNDRLRPLSLKSQGVDVLHAWPEYWDEEKGWISIDPTWGATSGGVDYFSKLDFNHFAFVRRGLSSQSPLPAGAYKIDDSQEGDVNVRLADAIIEPEMRFDLSIVQPTALITSSSTVLTILVTNTGSVSLNNLELNIEVQNLRLLNSNKIRIDQLPPYAVEEIPIQVANKTLFQISKGLIKARLGDKLVEQKVVVVSTFLLASLFLLLIFIFILILLLVVRIARIFRKYD